MTNLEVSSSPFDVIPRSSASGRFIGEWLTGDRDREVEWVIVNSSPDFS